MSAAAATAGVLCMEAMWTLFLPRFDVVRQVLEQGLLGEVRAVLADHGERFEPPHRILDPAMAGGSLLDLGSYLTALATWTLGPAQDVYATGEMTRGVNGQAAMVLTHGGGARSVLHTTLLTRTPTAAVIAGTAATLTPGPFFMPGDVVYLRRRQPDGDLGRARAHRPRRPVPLRRGGGVAGDGGGMESPLRPAADVIAGLRALDEVSRQLGVRYDAAR